MFERKLGIVEWDVLVVFTSLFFTHLVTIFVVKKKKKTQTCQQCHLFHLAFEFFPLNYTFLIYMTTLTRMFFFVCVLRGTLHVFIQFIQVLPLSCQFLLENLDTLWFPLADIVIFIGLGTFVEVVTEFCEEEREKSFFALVFDFRMLSFLFLFLSLCLFFSFDVKRIGIHGDLPCGFTTGSCPTGSTFSVTTSVHNDARGHWAKCRTCDGGTEHDQWVCLLLGNSD